MRRKVEIQKTATFSGHTDCIYAICEGELPTEFYTAGADGMIVKWDLNKPDEGVMVSKLENSIYTMAFLKELKLLLVCENQVGFRFLDVTNNTEVFNIPLPKYVFFDCKQFDNKIFVSTYQGDVFVVDVQKRLLSYIFRDSNQSARCIAINTKSQEIAIGFSDHFIRIYNLKTYELKNSFVAHQNSVFTMVYHQQSNTLISGSRDAHINTWDVTNSYLKIQTVPAHLFAINHFCFNDDQKYLFSCSMDKSIKIWDVKSLTLLKVIDKSRHAGHGTSINKLAFISNKLISISDDRKISVWDISIED